MRSLSISNRQAAFKIDTAHLRRIGSYLLRELLELADYELGIILVDAKQMARFHEDFMNIPGSTDVITFDYSDPREKLPDALRGEIAISLDDALSQSRQFKTRWQEELVRYVVHGILHLRGYDDLQPAPRGVMKREENRLCAKLGAMFDLRRVGRKRARGGVTASAR